MESKNPTEGLTTDHIKSHLQKYRISYERSKLEAQRLNEKHAKRSLKRHHREASEQHMHLTMQQRMKFHRELLLTRSVEVESGLSWVNRMGNHESSFLQAWANAEQLRQQQEQVYGRLHEQQQKPAQTAEYEHTGTDDGVDLTSWGRLSLTVDSDDDDVFGFLRSEA
ncbi:uncharacterized protein PITG_15402 [Phytophthora infestans T30-4]|uniref:HTH myb-type domain-containing protein n=1 Tax=Phytophthora infestans (strain T30-4) TaxID=403677 RepID=D0NR60_PHYIT|nr:uncharacterized protein PITG_15402 [Phytophthora infestans T30-4]EEY63182.1 conserved hypothetical protein [Phytophthora infestans T30-4]|eukprot:XP_002898359.1 conserved hypothetical protein [Phytophthora infestans T30-4]